MIWARILLAPFVFRLLVYITERGLVVFHPRNLRDNQPASPGKHIPCYKASVHHRPRWFPFVKTNGTWGCVSTTPSFCDGPLHIPPVPPFLPMWGMEGMEEVEGPEGPMGPCASGPVPSPSTKTQKNLPYPPYPPLRNISDLTSDDLGTHSTGAFWFRASFYITEWCLVVFHPWTLRDNQPASRGKAPPVL